MKSTVQPLGRPRKLSAENKDAYPLFSLKEMRNITSWLVDFFAGAPYRFLTVLFLGAIIMGTGSYEIVFVDTAQKPVVEYFAMIGAFLTYFIGFCLYSLLIVRGKWTTVWDHVRRSQAILSAKGRKNNNR